MRAPTRILLLAIAVIPLQVSAARAQAPADQAAEGQKLYEAGKFEDALAKFEAARKTLPPDRPDLADQLDFNRACAMQALKQPDNAEKLLREVDARTGSPALRSAARYNLGRIQAERADELAKTDPTKAIDTLKTAERFFRNALAESPGDTDTAKNIEIVQRKRADLMKQQDQQQKQDQKNKQNSPQQNKDDKKQDQQDKKDHQDQQPSQDQKDQQKQGPDQSSSEQNKQQKSDQKQQDQKQQQQQQGEDQQQNPDPRQQSQSQQNDKSKENKDQQSQPKPEDGKDDKQKDQKQADEKKDGKDQTAEQQQMSQADKEQKDQKAAREFDVQSAQILDKERQRREQIRKMFQQMMRARAAKVDKDW